MSAHLTHVVFTRGRCRAALALACGVGLFACTPIDGVVPDETLGLVSLTRLDEEPASAACAHGGVRVSAGLDRDADGTLADDEIDSTSFLCHGAPGAEAVTDLMRMTAMDVEACGPGPGVLIEIGRDDDGDRVLDTDEVDESGAVCDGAGGAAGRQALVDIEDAPACPDGGARIEAGFAAPGATELAPEDVLFARDACDGVNVVDAGATGAPGTASAIVVSDAGAECGPAGGTRVEIGTDIDGDGTLDGEIVDEVLVLCNAIPGAGVPSGPGAGTSEGTAGDRVVVPVSSFGDLSGGHMGSIAALGTSHYTFTTRSDHASMAYTVAFFGAAGAVSSTIVTAGIPTTALACAHETVDGALVTICRTPVLEPSTSVDLTVFETANVGSAYVVTVSAGANDSVLDVPLALAPVPPAGSSPLVVRGGVRELGTSTYALVAEALDHHTIVIDGIDAPDGDPGLEISLYREYVSADRHLATCAALACSTPRLEPGLVTVVAVRATHGRAAAFDLSLVGGDTLTPVLPLDTAVPFSSSSALMQIEIPSDDTYAITLTFGVADLYDDVHGDVPLQAFDLFTSNNALVDLEGPRRYYLRGKSTNTLASWHVTECPGQDGTYDDPVPLTVGVTRRSSTAEPVNIGYSTFTPSLYRFTPSVTGAYAIETVIEQPGYSGMSAEVFVDATFANESPTQSVRNAPQLRVTATDVLPANEEVYFIIEAYGAYTFALTVRPLDDVLALANTDGTPETVTSQTPRWTRLVIDADPTPFEVAMTDLASTVTVSLHTGSPVGPEVYEDARNSDGSLDVGFLSAGAYYMHVYSTSGTDTFELSTTAEAPTPLAIGVPLDATGLAPERSDWFRYSIVDAGLHHALMTVPLDGSSAVSRTVHAYDLTGVERAFGQSTVEQLDVPLGNIGSPHGPGDWLLRVRNSETTLPMAYTISVVAP